MTLHVNFSIAVHEHKEQLRYSFNVMKIVLSMEYSDGEWRQCHTIVVRESVATTSYEDAAIENTVRKQSLHEDKRREGDAVQFMPDQFLKSRMLITEEDDKK